MRGAILRLTILFGAIAIWCVLTLYNQLYGLHEAKFYGNISGLEIGDDVGELNGRFSHDRKAMFDQTWYERVTVRRKGGGSFVVVFLDSIDEDELDSLNEEASGELTESKDIPHLGEQVVFEIDEKGQVVGKDLSGIKDIENAKIYGALRRY